MSEEQQFPKQDPTSSGLGAFWAELKRRKVMRVAITYAVVAWLIIQVAATTFEGFGIPIWAFRFVMLCVILGFPLAIILAWAFELTPEGIKTTKVADEERDDAPVSEKQQRKRNWFSVVFAAAVPTVIFGALAVYFYATRSDTGGEADVEEKSIAVLPLENMSPDPDNAFFADGVQEDILTNLARIGELHVIARTSTQQYRNTTKTVEVIGEELGVEYLVEGSVRRAGNRVKVTVQLIDSRSGDLIWTDDYDRSLDDIFAIQADVAKEIAGQLEAVLSPQEIEKIEYRPTDNQQAYDLFVQFRQLLESPNLRNYEKKIELLENAVELDPTFAEAWARLAQERMAYWFNSGKSDSDLNSAAHFALDKAISLGKNIPQIPFAQGGFVSMERRDAETAISYQLEALAIDPSYYYAKRMLGIGYLKLGRLAEAHHFWDAVHKFDPMSHRSSRELLLVYELRGMWDEAKVLVRTKLAENRNLRFWKSGLAQLEYLQKGELEEFISARQDLIDTPDDSFELAKTALMSRRFESALDYLNTALASGRFESRFDFLSSVNDSISFELIEDYSWSNSLDFSSLNLLKALIYFVRGEKDIWLDETRIVKDDLNRSMKDASFISEPTRLSLLTICYALEDDYRRMESVIPKARELASREFNDYKFKVESEIHIAIAYLVLGEEDKALSTLEAASKMDGPIFLNRELWFIFDRLKGNPRFDALLKD